MKSRVLRKGLKTYLYLNRRIWDRLPDSLRLGFPGRVYGRHLHSVVCNHAERNQNHSTFFLRNRPELQLMGRLLGEKAIASTLELSVLACSKGAEVYSILWAIRSGRPDLRIHTNAIDISRSIVEFAERGIYSQKTADADTKDATWKDQPLSIFERLTSRELEAMFEIDGTQAKIRPWLKEGITWSAADVSDPGLANQIAPQDIVVANRFLCHMEPIAAERCLRNIARIVKRGGLLFVSGVDLDVRTKVARSSGWQPVEEMMREVHEGDVSLSNGWPLEWWGLEPFCRDLPDWNLRYASVFRIG